MALELIVNGEMRACHGDPRTSLCDVLREEIGLTGTKPVCGEGFCGACTVWVEGEAVPSCLIPVGLVGSREISTIEGIARAENLSKLQDAFLEHDVVQCGMCFPGMVMSLAPFLSRNDRPTRAEVKAALVGNACRCTGYERIVDAVMSLTGEAGR